MSKKFRGEGAAAQRSRRFVPRLKNYHLLPSVRGDLLLKLGRHEAARAAFEAAGLS